MTEYKYKYIKGVFSMEAFAEGELAPDPYDAICVSECPTEVGGSVACNTAIEPCPMNGVPTMAYMDALCLPDWEVGKDQIIRIFKDLSQQPGSQKYVADIINSWQTLVIMLFATIVITIAYIFALRFFVKPLLFFSMTVCFLIFVGGGFYSW